MIAITKKYKILFSFLVVTSLFLSGCSILKTFENIARLKYKLDSATDFKLSGIEIKNKSSIKDFNPIEILKLSTSLVKGSLPLTFNINVEAKNPNDGKGGFEQTDITISNFPWRLFLNDKEIIQGNIEKPILVPGKGESVIIPIQIQFDAAKSYKEKSLDDILSLILQVGGVKGSTSNIQLKVQPSLGTPIGEIKYPQELTIVDKSFN